MNKNYPFSELKQRLETASKILVVLPQKPVFDQVAAALSLSLSLQEIGRNASVVCPTPMTVEFNRLVGVNKISSQVQGTDLIISLNYPADQIEKVSYNDDGNQPNIVIQPKAGASSLTEALARYSYAGAGADLIVALGVKDLAGLDLSGLDTAGSFLINLDIDPGNSQFGQLNIVDYDSASWSEVVLGVIQGLNLPFSVDTAQNLLSGIWRQTRGLTNNLVGADTYEAVAACLRNGAQKPISEAERPAGQPPRENVFAPKTKFEPRPFPAGAEETSRPLGNQRPTEDKKAPETKKDEKGSPKPPADWFEPKIFRGNNFSS